MLLSFFRINDPYRLLGILVLMFLISLPLFINPVPLMLHELKAIGLGEVLQKEFRLYSEVITNTAPLQAFADSWMDKLFGRSLTARHIIAFLILFFQMSYFTITLINNKAHNENTYLPGLIFGLLSVFSFDMLSISAELFGSTFLLFALNDIFKEIEFRLQHDEIILTIGFYIGLASLIVFSYYIFLPGALIILALFTRLDVRKALLLLFGFFFPHGCIGVVYYMRGDFSSLVEYFYLANLGMSEGESLKLSAIISVFGIPILFLLISLFMLNREARLTKYQSQISQVLFLWIIISVGELLLSSEIKPHHFIIFIPSLSYFISHYILLIRKKRLAEIVIWVFAVSLVSVLYLSRYNRITSVDTAILFPERSTLTSIEGKSILVLGRGWDLYKNNTLATGFYDWKLYEPIFTDVDYFENVLLIDQGFSKDPPEVIVDPKDLMQKVFKKIPRLRNEYRREGQLYIKI